MDLRQYQLVVLKGMRVQEGVGRVPHAALGLTGEAGEVADIIKKSQYEGGRLDILHLIEELGDVLWYLTFLAGTFGWTLDELASLNIEKLKARKPEVYGKVRTTPEDPCKEGTCSCPAGYCA
jgi:NTP pyrophosphatase (non-canonical NTP hydrolase)